MLRECVAACMVMPAAGCSLWLDFSDAAIPVDAALDAPYSAAECDFKEPNDSVATAAPIAAEDRGPAAICAGQAEDHDFYRLSVPAGATRVELAITTMFRRTGDLDLRLYDAGGAVIARSSGFDDRERILCPGSVPSCPALTAGDYVLEVFPVPGSVNRYELAIMISP